MQPQKEEILDKPQGYWKNERLQEQKYLAEDQTEWQSNWNINVFITRKREKMMQKFWFGKHYSKLRNYQKKGIVRKKIQKLKFSELKTRIKRISWNDAAITQSLSHKMQWSIKIRILKIKSCRNKIIKRFLMEIKSC